MKEYEHGPRTTEEAHNALQRLIGPDWRKAGLTIPVDQVRDPDCVLMDVITERDLLRKQNAEIEEWNKKIVSTLDARDETINELEAERIRLNEKLADALGEIEKLNEYAALVQSGLSDYEARGTVWPEERIPQPPPSPPPIIATNIWTGERVMFTAAPTPPPEKKD